MSPCLPSRIVGTFDANNDLLPREREEFGRLGVGSDALDCPVPVRAGLVVYGSDGRFDLEHHLPLSLTVRTARAFLFLVEDMHGEPEDIVAWSPAIDRLATWRGAAWGLGQDHALAPRMDERDGLPVHRTPLEWLQADRRGLVIIRPRLAAPLLDDAGPLLAADRDHARELRDALTRKGPRILVPARQTERRVAA